MKNDEKKRKRKEVIFGIVAVAFLALCLTIGIVAYFQPEDSSASKSLKGAQESLLW